ncbi:MAG: lysine--tRNA ligase [Clostridiales bacterium]|jgi:lysyl-tRNA synthetase class 1|nr:lysine--tRNA ligase [Clostridiales bacterium]
MHWSERIAQDVIKRNPDKEMYTCAAGISPSGSIHIGNFRDIATSLFVAKALVRLGKKSRLLFSWDEFDRLRKIPKNVREADPDMERFIGYPYSDVKNPFPDGAQSFADHFEREFEAAVIKFGIEMEYRHQTRLYRSGAYKEHVIHALRRRAEIFDILDSFRTQDSSEGEKDSYYPVSIYCPACRKDSTWISKLSEDCIHAEYECACGYHGAMDFMKDFNCKLAWKVDWPMRWLYEQVDFEPGGKDHAAPNGSYQTSKVISEKIFNYPAPLFQGYEFIGLKGTTGKMSGSTGLNLTPADLLKIYQPQVILWLYSKTEPGKAFDFCFDDGILRQYHEFDSQYKAYIEGTADESVKTVMENSMIEGREIIPVPLNLIVELGSIVNFNVDLMIKLFEKISVSCSREGIEERLPLARYWIEQCAPDKRNALRKDRNWTAYEAFSEEEKEDVKTLKEFIAAGGYSMDELNHKLYDIIKAHGGASMDKGAAKKKQAAFFANIYRLLIDKDAGPRLYLFLYALEPSDYLPLLDFSAPRLEGEDEGCAEEQPKGERVYGASDPVLPIRDEISMESFEAVDLRVCKVLKCREIRKSNNCFKLTVYDGLGERVIVSSLKGEYSCEELTGRKIIVAANLKPARIAGVTSQGMLLAATNGACGCKVLFADDLVPEGTCVR